MMENDLVRYVGYMVGGVPDGWGRMTWHQEQYEGGRGTYEGDFVGGVACGKGAQYFWGGEKIYRGEFRKGVPHGLGVVYRSVRGVLAVDEAGYFAEGQVEVEFS